MDINFAKQVILNMKKEQIVDYDFWISRDMGGECAEGNVGDIIDAVQDLVENENGSIRSGNYCVIYNEGYKDDEGDKVFIFKDYIELTIPRRIKN